MGGQLNWMQQTTCTDVQGSPTTWTYMCSTPHASATSMASAISRRPSPVRRAGGSTHTLDKYARR
jgi:hypothetical protein